MVSVLPPLQYTDFHPYSVIRNPSFQDLVISIRRGGRVDCGALNSNPGQTLSRGFVCFGGANFGILGSPRGRRFIEDACDRPAAAGHYGNYFSNKVTNKSKMKTSHGKGGGVGELKQSRQLGTAPLEGDSFTRQGFLYL
ncbi:hypothetical protein J6590_001960 [Homalodisca vitripennis]|nr:hypothetical protein J6590_001960 [Homalodisca vitripennis]